MHAHAIVGSPTRVSSSLSRQVHLEMLEKEVSSLREEVETLNSSLAASRTENSMLKSRIEEVNAGQDLNGLFCLRACIFVVWRCARWRLVGS